MPAEPAPAAAALTRRDLIVRVARLLGGASLIGGTALLDACASPRARSDVAAGGVGQFAAADIALLDAIAETILPATGTPGAKAAATGAFMALMVTEAYDLTERRVFRRGMRQIDKTCERMHGVPFLAATPAQRHMVLEPMDREQKTEADAREAIRLERVRAFIAAPAEEPSAPSRMELMPPHYFRMMKELALLGYFTSEIGYHHAMRYIESPGRFDPCAPHTPGDTVWAAHA